MFKMYYAAPASRYNEIMKDGINLRPPPFKRGMFSPVTSVIYLCSSIEIAQDYCNKAYKTKKSNAVAWQIWEVTYPDPLPMALHPDTEWMMMGIYYVVEGICKEHVHLVKEHFVKDVIRARSNRIQNLPKIDY